MISTYVILIFFCQADSCAFSQTPPTNIPTPEGNNTVGDYNNDDDDDEEEEEKDEGKCAFYFNINKYGICGTFPQNSTTVISVAPPCKNKKALCKPNIYCLPWL